MNKIYPKLCPFCGETPSVEPWHGGGTLKRMVSCGNENCYVQPEVTGSTRKQAINRWNYRTPQT